MKRGDLSGVPAQPNGPISSVHCRTKNRIVTLQEVECTRYQGASNVWRIAPDDENRPSRKVVNQASEPLSKISLTLWSNPAHRRPGARSIGSHREPSAPAFAGSNPAQRVSEAYALEAQGIDRADIGCETPLSRPHAGLARKNDEMAASHDAQP
jgi:hypothetical protein